MKPKPPEISEVTLTRRSLLNWLGKTTVLTLGAGLLASCSGTSEPADEFTDLDSSPNDTLDLNDTSANQTDTQSQTTDTDNSTDVNPEVTQPELAFAPGESEHSVFTGWGERTVDRQELESILQNWTLTVDGMVETPITLSFAELLNISRTDMLVDFHCVEGWSIYDVPWKGIHLSDLFSQVGVSSEATHVTFHTIGGSYNESLPLPIALEPRTLLAYGIGDETLPLRHGFPLRIVIPRLLAYKSAKYIERIELTNRPVNGFWVSRGYPYDGLVPERRLRDGKY